MLVVVAVPVAAQPSRVYAGGSLNAVYQTQFDAALGGGSWGGSAVFGVQVTPRVAIEFEPLFAGGYSWEYTYRPTRSGVATVVASRRDRFFSFLVRRRAGGAFEPVVGVSFIRGTISRHATFQGGLPYFDDLASQLGLALTAGLDGAIPVAPHLFFVPTIRVLAIARLGSSADPLWEQTNTGPLLFRAGVGARVTF
jgi:hypothetical protein